MSDYPGGRFDGASILQVDPTPAGEISQRLRKIYNEYSTILVHVGNSFIPELGSNNSGLRLVRFGLRFILSQSPPP